MFLLILELIHSATNFRVAPHSNMMLSLFRTEEGRFETSPIMDTRVLVNFVDVNGYVIVTINGNEIFYNKKGLFTAQKIDSGKQKTEVGDQDAEIQTLEKNRKRANEKSGKTVETGTGTKEKKNQGGSSDGRLENGSEEGMNKDTVVEDGRSSNEEAAKEDDPINERTKVSDNKKESSSATAREDQLRPKKSKIHSFKTQISNKFSLKPAKEGYMLQTIFNTCLHSESEVSLHTCNGSENQIFHFIPVEIEFGHAVKSNDESPQMSIKNAREGKQEPNIDAKADRDDESSDKVVYSEEVTESDPKEQDGENSDEGDNKSDNKDSGGKKINGNDHQIDGKSVNGPEDHQKVEGPETDTQENSRKTALENSKQQNTENDKESRGPRHEKLSKGDQKQEKEDEIEEIPDKNDDHKIKTYKKQHGVDKNTERIKYSPNVPVMRIHDLPSQVQGSNRQALAAHGQPQGRIRMVGTQQGKYTPMLQSVSGNIAHDMMIREDGTGVPMQKKILLVQKPVAKRQRRKFVIVH